jgi:uncharacterized repeat protein (TIGR01451 family)
MKKSIFVSFSLFILFKTSVHGQVIQPFTIFKQVTQRGDITFAANTMLSCNGTGTCNTNRMAISPAGSGNAAYSNNNYNPMVYVDADGTGIAPGIGSNSFSSSASDLTLGASGGCGVIYALLVWGGNINTVQADYANRNKVNFRVPGALNYVQLTADDKYDATTPFTGYYCYKDVTSLVRASGAGTFWVANQVLQTGLSNLSGGWSLIVIYSDPLLTLRNLTVFKGLAAVSTGNNADIPISGFFTPPNPAPVNLKLGVFAFEGDRGGAGDLLSFNGAGSFIAVGDAKHPTTPAASANSFTSTINNNTAEFTTNQPYFPNTLGIDANIFVPNNATKTFIGNSASSATLRMTTTSDVYAPFAVTTAIDVFEPDIKPVMSFVNLNANTPAHLGDIIEYTLNITNNGTDPAENLIIIDSLYGAMNFVPGSLEILTGPNAGIKTDAIGDDQLEYVPATNVIRARLGVGATGVDGTGGGTLSHIAPDNTTSFKFRVAITNDCTMFTCNSKIDNVAFASFKGFTSQAIRSTYSAANGLDALGCPLTGPVSITVTVPPCTLPSDTTFAACSPYNPNLLLSKRPDYSTFLNSSFTAVTSFTTSGTYYMVKTIVPSFTWMPACRDTVQVNFTSTGACPILPVRLTDFRGQIKTSGVLLSWTTQTEIENDYFVLYRSYDGINFVSVDTIKGGGTTSYLQKYQFNDNTVIMTDKAFYKLESVNFDRTKSYTSTILVKFTQANSGALTIGNVVPNPSKQNSYAEVNVSQKGDYRIQLITTTGQVVDQQIRSLLPGFQKIEIERKKLSAGMYFFVISNSASGEKQLTKIIFE